MSKSSQKYHTNKRKGSQPIQHKRSPKNKHKWESRVGYAVRLLNRQKWFKVKNIDYVTGRAA